MAFTITLAYILLTFLSVSDTFPDLIPYRVQLIVGIVGILVTIPRMFMRREGQFLRQVLLMAAFSGFVIFSWLPHGWFGGTIIALQQFMPLGIVFFLTAFNISSVRDLRILRLGLLGFTLYILGRGLSDYYWNPESSPLVMIQTEFDVTIARLQAQGVLADPNAFAQFLLAMLPLLFVGFKGRSTLARFAFILPMAALILVGIFCTHSRGALIGLVVLVGLLVRQRIRFAGSSVISGLLGIGLLAAGFTGGRTISVAGGMDRLDLWSDGLGLFKTSPIWGIGFNGFTEKLIYTAHNSFLLCATELGLIGYFLWMALLIVSAWQLYRIVQTNLTEDKELKEWANAILFSLVAFLTPGFFLSETYASMLYLLLGMAAAVTRLAVTDTGVELLPERNHWALKTAMACVGSIALIYVMVRLRAV